MKKRLFSLLLAICITTALVMADGAVTAENNTILYGDATDNGEIDSKDLVRLKKYLAAYDYDTETSDVEIGAGADANGDGIIENKDLVRLKKYLAGLDYDTGESDIILGPDDSPDILDPDGEGWTDFFPC